ncbi:MAG TPA: hypothetical protein VKG80_06330 [Trebonia sp.]|nr:hypothetical protein [Trebonia sp.]
MSLRFHWFLPTNGDGRDILGAGLGSSHPAPGSQPPQTITPFAPTAAREPAAAT